MDPKCTGCDGEGEVSSGSSVPDDDGFTTCMVCDGKKTQPTNEEIIKLREELCDAFYEAKSLKELVIPELESRMLFLSNLINKAPHAPDCLSFLDANDCTCWKRELQDSAKEVGQSRDTSVCPKCGSHDIVGDEVVIDANEARQECGCNECDAEWTDIYRHSETIT